METRYSDDGGATWSPALQVNDDATTNSQFLPKISLDPTTGKLAVVWYDSRNDLGTGGSGDTDGIANDDAQFWGAFSTNGGASFTPNLQISAGTSNSRDSGNGIDYRATADCRSTAGLPIQRDETIPTAPATTQTARCTSWTSIRRR